MWLLKIFFHSVGFLFILLVLSFAQQKDFSLIHSCLTFACVFGIVFKKDTAKTNSLWFSPLFSLYQFHNFRSSACILVYFLLIFICSMSIQYVQYICTQLLNVIHQRTYFGLVICPWYLDDQWIIYLSFYLCFSPISAESKPVGISIEISSDLQITLHNMVILTEFFRLMKRKVLKPVVTTREKALFMTQFTSTF